jgi:lysophospholipase L1-like esterase
MKPEPSVGSGYNVYMRRLLIPLLVICALLLGGGWYWTRTNAAQEPYRPAGPGAVYVALGDSLAAGFTVDQPEDAYVARIAAALRQAQPIEVRNFAVPGETSVSLLRRQLPQALAYIKEQRAAGKRVSPITLDIGGNDAQAVQSASNEQRRQTIAMIEANIGSALDQLIDATSSGFGERTADIAIMTYYNPYPGDPADQSSRAYWSTQLNAAITRAATARGVAVADVAGAFAGGNVYRYTYIAAGDVHANSDGHRLIAERFLQALQYPQVR